MPKATPKATASGIPVWCAHDKIGKLADAIENPKNPNKHPKKQIKLLAKIISIQGWRRPITISKRSGMITKGVGAKKAAEYAGWAEAPFDFQDYATEAQEHEDLMADNRIPELSDIDEELVKDLLQTIEGIDAELAGYDLAELGLVASEKKDDPGAREDEAEELQAIWETAPGQIWEIPSESWEGKHRVMCGDACSSQDLARLMGRHKADMIFTDPPYGVDYSSKNDFLNAADKGNRNQTPIENDAKTPEQMGEFWAEAFRALFDVAKVGCVYYVTGPQGGDLMLQMLMAIKEAGWLLKHTLVWVKNNHVLGRADYNYKHEPILQGYKPGEGFDVNHAPVLYGWKKGSHRFYGDASESSVWEIPKPQKSDLHPTMKPVELIERALSNSTIPGGLVVDSFLGSGSSIIAAERSQRICFGMEIDPKYVAVILQRCKDMGLEPKKIED